MRARDAETTRDRLRESRSPSALHRFKVMFQNGDEFGETCQRCGSHFNTRADGTAAVYCYPTPAWLAANLSDDGALGIDATGRRCGEYGRPL